MPAVRDVAMGTRAGVRKPPKNEPAIGGTCARERTLSYAGCERLYNLKATARILLNGDLMFPVAKMTQPQPWRDEAYLGAVRLTLAR